MKCINYYMINRNEIKEWIAFAIVLFTLGISIVFSAL